MALTATEEALVRQLLDQQAAIRSLAGNEATITSKLGAAKVTLSDLVSARVVADADLFLLRQGTTDKSVTPSVLKAYTSSNASATVRGLIELATLAEVQAGVDTERAVTPATLSNIVVPASATVRGLIELATLAEVQAGVDTERAVTPATLSNIVVPAGTILYLARNTAPSGYLKANGAAISRTMYSALFGAIGTVFGAGDGATTFNLPDLRGEFPRGWDGGRGIDPGRVFGSAQGGTVQSHSHGIVTYRQLITRLGGGDGNMWDALTGGATGSFGDSETRPRNVALLACIKF